MLEIFGQTKKYWDYLGPQSLELWKEYIEHIFETEHDGRWAPLRRKTVEERIWLRDHTNADLVENFAPAHPILQRRGYLRRSLSDRFFSPRSVQEAHLDGPDEHSVGNTIHWKQESGRDNYSVHWQQQDDRFIALHTGFGLVNTPSRPMVPDTGKAYAPDPEPLFRKLDETWLAAFREFANV